MVWPATALPVAEGRVPGLGGQNGECSVPATQVTDRPGSYNLGFNSDCRQGPAAPTEGTTGRADTEGHPLSFTPAQSPALSALGPVVAAVSVL